MPDNVPSLQAPEAAFGGGGRLRGYDGIRVSAVPPSNHSERLGIRLSGVVGQRGVLAGLSSHGRHPRWWRGGFSGRVGRRKGGKVAEEVVLKEGAEGKFGPAKARGGEKVVEPLSMVTPVAGEDPPTSNGFQRTCPFTGSQRKGHGVRLVGWEDRGTAGAGCGARAVAEEARLRAGKKECRSQEEAM